MFELFDPDVHLAEQVALEEEVALETVDEEAVDESLASFALEAHLEEFLLSNWKSIEWGQPLDLWTGPQGESGHQLSTPVGVLDFLCVDQSSGALVVVELKRGKTSDRVVGQAARYIGWVRAEVAEPDQNVEGLIITHESDDQLRYAVSAVPGLRLMTYEVSFNLRSVDAPPRSKMTVR